MIIYLECSVTLFGLPMKSMGLCSVHARWFSLASPMAFFSLFSSSEILLWWGLDGKVKTSKICCRSFLTLWRKRPMQIPQLEPLPTLDLCLWIPQREYCITVSIPSFQVQMLILPELAQSYQSLESLLTVQNSSINISFAVWSNAQAV